jgi:ankyrin repeat protein
MLAAMRGRTSNVRFLLEHGADPNLRGLGQSTALHACVFPVTQLYDEEDRREALAVARCMRLLIQHGASLDLKDEDGLTPVDMALTIARKRKGLGWNDPRLKELGIERPKASSKSHAKKART